MQINRYDTEGLRHEMEEDGKLVQFIFRGDEIVTEETENKVIRFIRGYDLIASDAESARTYYHYASDEMSSITHVVEETNVLNHYEYDAWGNTTVCEETVENRFRFNGQQLDPITQQYYLRARFYNPVIARFTQEDTYRGDGLNLYAYCANNPVYYEDPSGHWCDRKEKVYKDLLKERGITEADLANDPDLKLSLMAEASNIVKAEKKNAPQTPQAQVPDSESRTHADFIVGENGTIVSGKVYNMSNADFIQEVADIANMRVNEELSAKNQKTTGRRAGTYKHSAAKEIVDDYQRNIADRNLDVEICYKGNSPTQNNANIKGCTRLDVYDRVAGQVYDYKFVINPGNGLSQTQINKIIQKGPGGLTAADIHEVNPR